jgi:hypothetical protein
MVSDASSAQDREQARANRAPRPTASRLKSGCQSVIGIIALALVSCTTVSQAQTGSTPAQTSEVPQQIPAARESPAPAADGLKDLDAVTFGCARAGLNAAGREAAKAPSQGTYQFSFFKIIRDSHHSLYEVHFKSNYPGEPDLKYCISIYCQQGWDPKTAQTSVKQMAEILPRSRAAAHATRCSDEHSAKPRTK